MIPHYHHEYSMISYHNNFDVQLYRYANQLFTGQILKVDCEIEVLRTNDMSLKKLLEY